MKNIKLCIFDLDGTLLNSDKEITEKTLNTIKKLKENNIKYTIATGRIDTLARKYQRQIQSDLPIISCNGSLIRDMGNKIYYMKTLDFNTVKSIFNFFTSSNIHFLFYTENLILSTKNNPREEFLKKYNETANKEDRFNIEILDDNIDKYSNIKFLKSLTYIENRTKLLETQDILLKNFKELSIVSSDYTLLDLMPPNTTKGSGVENLCKILNLSKDEICVFGDNFNDLEMIQFAGTSVAPSNAEENIKNISTYITKSNDEDGVAYAIEEYILKKV